MCCLRRLNRIARLTCWIAAVFSGRGLALALVIAAALMPDATRALTAERLVTLYYDATLVRRAATVQADDASGLLLSLDSLGDAVRRLLHDLPRVTVAGSDYVQLDAWRAGGYRFDGLSGRLDLLPAYGRDISSRALTAVVAERSTPDRAWLVNFLRPDLTGAVPTSGAATATATDVEAGIVSPVDLGNIVPAAGLIAEAAPTTSADTATAPVPRGDVGTDPARDQAAAATAPPGAQPEPLPNTLPISPEEQRPVSTGTFGAPAGEGIPVRRPSDDPPPEPVLPDDAWTEWVLAVTLNGQSVSEGSLVLRRDDGAVAVRLEDARAWRIQVEEADIVRFDGDSFVPLASLAPEAIVFDDVAQRLTVTLAGDRFSTARVDLAKRAAVDAAANLGSYIDYDVLGLAGDGVETEVDALVEAGAFGDWGVLNSNWRADDVAGDGREVVRLETSFAKDFLDSRTTLRIGDAITVSGTLGQPVRFAGVQYASNFATDPSFITFPRPTIAGFVEQDSVVDVLVNNLRRSTSDVPAGPFALENIPVLTGAGEVQLRVTDLLGREQIITQPYFVTPRLLRAGLDDFAVQAGVLRENFGEESFDYGEPLAVGRYRRGLNDRVTGEIYAEATPERQATGVGMTSYVPSVGLFSTALLGSHDDDTGLGSKFSADYEYRARRFSFGARTSMASENFRQQGTEGETIKRTDQLSFGLNFGRHGQLGLFGLNRVGRADADDQRSISASFSRRIGPGTLLVNGLQNFTPDSSFTATASYALSLGPRNFVTTSVSRDGAGEPSARINYRRSRGLSDLGFAGTLSAETRNDVERVEAGLSYNLAQVGLDLDLARSDDRNRVRGNVSGSIALLDGRLRASRRLGRAFGLVAAPGLSGVRVYLDNREVGRTDANGYLMVPNLRPYERNKLSLDVGDLPLDAQIEQAEIEAVPYANSGMLIAFASNVDPAATMILLDASGEPLLAGLVLSDAGGTVQATVARDGLAYATGLREAATVRVDHDGVTFVCELPQPPRDDPLPDLGTLTCQQIYR